MHLRIKAVGTNRFDSLFELNLRDDSVAVVNHRLTVISVPSVHWPNCKIIIRT